MQSGTATLQLAPPVEAEQAKGAEAVPVLERSAPNTRSLVAKGLFGLDPARSRAVAIFMIDWAFANTRKHKEYPDGRIESRLARDRLLMAAGGPIPAYVERVLIPFMRKSA